jgi:hypothetical protein
MINWTESELLAIMRGYKVGMNISNCIQKIWDMDALVPKQAGFFSQTFNTSWRVRQGDIISPMIFNAMSSMNMKSNYYKTTLKECTLSTCSFMQMMLLGKMTCTKSNFLDLYTSHLHMLVFK